MNAAQDVFPSRFPLSEVEKQLFWSILWSGPQSQSLPLSLSAFVCLSN